MHRMLVLGLAMVALLCHRAASPSEHIEIPARKAGYWEISVAQGARVGMPAINARVCVDAASDKAMVAVGLSLTQDRCSKEVIKRDDGAIVVESECEFAGTTSKTKTVLTGDLQSSYKVIVTGTADKMLMTQNANRLSDKCPDGIKAGDIQMLGGINANINKILEKK